MKKGISLIVLVITILVMIILAGAVIITLSNQNIVAKARWAELASSRANLQHDVQLDYADYVASNDGDDTGYAYEGELPDGFTMDSTGKNVVYYGTPTPSSAGVDTPDWFSPDVDAD